jgi:hypothetical protein
MWWQWSEKAGAGLGFHFYWWDDYFLGLPPLSDGETFEYGCIVVMMVAVGSTSQL